VAKAVFFCETFDGFFCAKMDFVKLSEEWFEQRKNIDRLLASDILHKAGGSKMEK